MTVSRIGRGIVVRQISDIRFYHPQPMHKGQCSFCGTKRKVIWILQNIKTGEIAFSCSQCYILAGNFLILAKIFPGKYPQGREVHIGKNITVSANRQQELEKSDESSDAQFVLIEEK